jgi:hypothetical protein
MFTRSVALVSFLKKSSSSETGFMQLLLDVDVVWVLVEVSVVDGVIRVLVHQMGDLEEEGEVLMMILAG